MFELSKKISDKIKEFLSGFYLNEHTALAMELPLQDIAGCNGSCFGCTGSCIASCTGNCDGGCSGCSSCFGGCEGCQGGCR